MTRFITPFRCVLLGLGLFILAGFYTSIASAQVSCANVRCAGTCIDTPAGPQCVQRQTCASTLCAVGNQCVESAQGPQCVPTTPLSQPNVQPQYEQGYTVWPQHYHRSYPSYRRNSYGFRRGYTHRQRAHRHHYPVYRPYNYGYGHYGYRPSYQPYQPLPSPRVDPPVASPGNGPGNGSGNGMGCPMNYDPVCAQKQVQCVRAPCPPVKQTFGNACQATVEDYTVIYKGTCR